MTRFIEPYNPDWKLEFEKINLVLQSALQGLKIDIQHVGSTAVPGLVAKPILDIDIIIDNKGQLDEITSRLENIGYASKGEQGIPGRFAFRQISESTPITIPVRKWQVHHLYVCYSDSLALKNHLLFRDALIRNKDLAAKYDLLKRSLTEESGITKEEYTIRKTGFISSVLASLEFDKDELKEIFKDNV